MASRVILYEPNCPAEARAATALAEQGFEVVECQEVRTVLEQVVQGHTDALVFALCNESGQDLGILRLIRRAAPDLPLVLLARDDSLAVRRELQYFNPIYFAVWPADPLELREAVCAALLKAAKPKSQQPRRAGAM